MKTVPALFPLLLALAVPARAQQAVNPIHPVFAPLDAAGQKVRSAAAVSYETTCGACHDTRYIGEHSGHASGRARATCAACHLDGGRLEVRAGLLDAEGRVARAAVRIGTPRAGNCATCHGLVSGGGAMVRLPASSPALPTAAGQTWTLLLGEGAVISPERMADSFLNLEGREALDVPWDVHAAKLVDCVACHHAGNDPSHADARQATLRYLTADPRRQGTAEFLLRPDHRLAARECRSCHDPLKAHAFLPYRARHMAVLSCQACHVPGPMGPVAEMVDATVATTDGTPAVRWRNVAPAPGESLNTAVIRPFRPLLVPRREGDGVERLAPVNTVSRFGWLSAEDRQPVPFEQVVAAFREGDRWAPAVLRALDADRDGRLDERELRLDTPAKVGAVAARLEALGVRRPVIEGTLDTYPLAHGISSRARALRDCAACHSADSRISEPFSIAGYLPGGTPPRPPDGARVQLAGVVAPAPGGGLWLERDAGSAPAGLHVLGHSRQRLSNTVGFWLFLATSLGVAAHALVRLLTRRRRGAHAHAASGRVYVFGRYERIWHWTMALSGVLLVATGLEIHRAGTRGLLALPTAVSLHNVFAGVLMLNAFLALFYHLTTRAIRNFIPEPRGFLAQALEHMAYQSRGIFLGGPHPANPSGAKLNPLQQVTYLALLNVLFPLQIASGALLWAVGTWPDLAGALGGLQVVAPLHNAGSWLFLSFFVLHVYLVSTGPTPTEHLTSMITGYRTVPGDGAEPERS